MAIDYWDIYVLGQMDPKFRDVPSAAFEISLFGAGLFSAVGSALFLAGLALAIRLWGAESPRGMLLGFSLLLGAVDALGVRLLYSWSGGGGSYAPVAWVCICCFPLLYSVALLRLGCRHRRLS